MYNCNCFSGGWGVVPSSNMVNLRGHSLFKLGNICLIARLLKNIPFGFVLTGAFSGACLHKKEVPCPEREDCGVSSKRLHSTCNKVCFNFYDLYLSSEQKQGINSLIIVLNCWSTGLNMSHTL